MRDFTQDVARRAVRIHTRRWEPAGPVKGVVGLVHGLGEHSGRYDGFAARMTGGGFAVESFDLRGHRLSGGARSDARFAATFDDIDALLGDAAGRFPDRPRCGSRAVAAALGPDRCQLVVYDGLYHELHHEPERGRSWRDVLAWLGGQLA